MISNQKIHPWFNLIDESIQITKYPNSISGGLNFYREWNKKFYQHDIRIISTACGRKLIKDTIKELFIKKYNNKFFKNYEVANVIDDRTKNNWLVMGKSLRCRDCNSKEIGIGGIINDMTGISITYIVDLWCQSCWKYKRQLEALKE